MIFPTPVFEPLVTINPFSLESLGGGAVFAYNGGLNGVGSNTTWFAANTALFYPFYLTKQITVQQLFWLVGSSTSGHTDCGIYTSDGEKVISTGSTVTGGTIGLKSVSITPTTIGPGLYYMALALDNTVADILAISTATTSGQLLGLVQMASAFPLPTSATFASITTTALYIYGLTTNTVI